MTIEISTAIVISVLSLSFSVYMGIKSNKRTDTKDLAERVANNTTINVKLDAINSSTQDIKEQMSSLVKKVEIHGERLVKVEESSKSAHRRLDELMRRIDKEGDE